MKLLKGIRIKDIKIGDGQIADAGSYVHISYKCFLPQGGLIQHCIKKSFKVGRRDNFVGIEYGVLGMAAGGIREIKVSPHLTYYEKNIFPSLPDKVSLKYIIELLAVGEVPYEPTELAT